MVKLGIICFFICSSVFCQKIQLTLFAFNDPKELVAQDKSKHSITIFHGDPFKLNERQILNLNRLKIDFAMLGKKALSSQFSLIKKLIPKINFPLICSNLLTLDESLFQKNKQSIIFNFEGIKIGAFSLVSSSTSSLLKKTKDYLLISDAFTSKEKIKDLQSKDCDAIIAFVEDEGSVKLLKSMDEIDIIVCFSANQTLSSYEDKTLIYYFSKSSDSLNRIDILIEKTSLSKGKVVNLYPYW